MNSLLEVTEGFVLQELLGWRRFERRCLFFQSMYVLVHYPIHDGPLRRGTNKLVSSHNHGPFFRIDRINYGMYDLEVPK